MSDGLSLASARMSDLTQLMEYVDGACARAQVPEDAAFAIRLAVEEAFTNIVEHGYGADAGPVRCTVHADGDVVTVTFVDEAPPFDPADAPAPDLESDWETRLEGGLGWHLVRQIMDEVRHEPGASGGNVVTLVKRVTV